MMKLRAKTIAIFLFGLLMTPSDRVLGDNLAAIDVYDLKVEHLNDPIALDVLQPRMSWKIRVSDSATRNVEQNSYRILVASDQRLLSLDKGDLWDSGQISSSQSVLVKYRGETLQSRQPCFWKVRVTDNKGQDSGWSDVAKWEMALLDSSQWSGSKWIGIRKKARRHPLAARTDRSSKESLQSQTSPLLRKEITISKPIRRARVCVSGIGYSEFYINGEKVGNHVLDPGQTNYEKRTLYVTHDVTDMLNRGPNALGVWLGNGFYGQDIGFKKRFGYGQPCVRAKLFVEYEDQTSESFGTDTTWKATASPIVFDNVYWGESYDARMEIPNWSNVGLDDSAWRPAISLAAPCSDNRLRPQLLPPIKEVERVEPVAIRQVESGTWLLDFGKNLAGWVSINVNQKPGDVIKVVPAEVLNEDKTRIDQRTYGGASGYGHELIYVCKGNGDESWSPRFTYAGFQYVEISGLASAPTADSVQAVFVRSAVEKTGSFSCSEDLLNQQYSASLLSMEGNLHSLPEDCPNREKCGWLGDAHATTDLCLYNYDIFQFYSKFNQDINESLTTQYAAEGFGSGKRSSPVPSGIEGIPTYIAPGKRTSGIGSIDWGVAYLILPWQMYLHSGDANAFEPHFKHIKDFIAYFRTFKTKQGVIDNGLGDWCPPRWDRRTAPQFMECHPYVSGTAFYYQALQIAGQMAEILGDQQYSQQCFDEAEEVKSDFAKVYLKTIENTDLKHFGSQTATVMALKLGMVDPSDSQEMTDALVHDINELHDGHHSCGIHGLRHLYTVLADNGRDDLVFRMLTDTTFPSPGYVLSCGLTTWPERRFEWKKVRLRNSFNHPMNGGFVAFMHESLGGIRPSKSGPGYKHFSLRPHLTEQLKWVKASIESPFGAISSEWNRRGDSFSWDIEIPINTSATVYIPAGSKGNLFESGKPFKETVTVVHQGQRDWLECELGSGKYRFVVK